MQNIFKYVDRLIQRSNQHLDRVLKSVPAPHIKLGSKFYLTDKARKIKLIKADEDLSIALDANPPLVIGNKILTCQCKLPLSYKDLSLLQDKLANICHRLYEIHEICLIGQNKNPDEADE